MNQLAVLLGGCKLTEDQELLLKAAFLAEQPAKNAWNQWKSRIDLDTIASSDYALLPQLYQNLLNLQVEDPHLARLKGVYRRAWYANQLQIKQLEPILAAIRDAGIEVIVLGDVALSTYYESQGTRPICYFHFLLHPKDLEKVADALKPLNWFPVGGQIQSSFQLQNEQKQSIYVQAHLFWVAPQSQTDQWIWQQSISGEFGQVLGTIDQLLHVCSQAFLRRQSCRIQYVADAVAILRSTTTLDWAQLIAQAQRYQLILPLSNMLILLHKVLQVPVPAWVLSSLSKRSIASGEWQKYQVWEGHQQLFLQSAGYSLVGYPLSRLKSGVFRLRQQHFPGRQTLKQLLYR